MNVIEEITTLSEKPFIKAFLSSITKSKKLLNKQKTRIIKNTTMYIDEIQQVALKAANAIENGGSFDEWNKKFMHQITEISNQEITLSLYLDKNKHKVLVDFSSWWNMIAIHKYGPRRRSVNSVAQTIKETLKSVESQQSLQESQMSKTKEIEIANIKEKSVSETHSVGSVIRLITDILKYNKSFLHTLDHDDKTYYVEKYTHGAIKMSLEDDIVRLSSCCDDTVSFNIMQLSENDLEKMLEFYLSGLHVSTTRRSERFKSEKDFKSNVACDKANTKNDQVTTISLIEYHNGNVTYSATRDLPVGYAWGTNYSPPAKYNNM